MKIVQSFWSKPARELSHRTQNRQAGGWLHEKYNLMSWALSCLQFRTFYENVELVTDQAGKDLLIDRLGLPYSHVSLDLTELDVYPADLWALGKLVAYRVQQQPFIHADGDVIIWQRFPAELEAAPLLAQCRDAGFIFYEQMMAQIRQSFTYVPLVLESACPPGMPLEAAVAGIIGGQNLDFIHHFVQEAFKFVDRNLEALPHIKAGQFNPIFEQLLFFYLARQTNQSIQYYSTAVDDTYATFRAIYEMPRDHTYFHPMGLYKKQYRYNREVEYWLRLYHPTYYYRVMQLVMEGIV